MIFAIGMDEEEWTEEDPSSENTPSDEASEGYEGLNELYGALDDQLECEVDEDYDAIRVCGGCSMSLFACEI